MHSKIISLMQRNREYIRMLPHYEQFVFSKILACKTEAVPSLFTRCDSCGSTHPVYKSCKDRLCPLCNRAASLKWSARREAELLPTHYFMLTYTIPSSLRNIFLLNKKLCYTLLFQAASRSLREGIEHNDRELQGIPGFFAVLHTWQQRLLYHPHIHIVVPGGCIDKDATRWIPSSPAFFVPVKKQSFLFKKELLGSLRKVYANGRLIVPENMDAELLFKQLEQKKWVVHSKAQEKEMNTPAHIVRYLSRYVAKAPIDEKRIDVNKSGTVTLGYYDRKQKKRRVDSMTEVEFLKRLVLHILPKGFKKVRFYGFMANRHRRSKLILCRILLGDSIASQTESVDTLLDDTAFLFWKYFGIDITRCSDCSVGHIHFVRGHIDSG